MNLLMRYVYYFLPMHVRINYLRRLGLRVGRDCEIYRTAKFGSEPYLISIGNHVRINGGVNFVTHDGGCWVLREEQYGFDKKFKAADCFGRIIVKDNVHIGTNAIIMPGVTIGKNSIVACGAVVTHDVLPHTVVGGIPAYPIETIEEYAGKMENKFVPTKGLSGGEKRAYLEQ